MPRCSPRGTGVYVVNATNTQTAASSEIAAHVENIVSMTEQTIAASRNNAEAANELSELAGQLHKNLEYFKV
jgi:methyl-accepting chemotaxis protein